MEHNYPIIGPELPPSDTLCFKYSIVTRARRHLRRSDRSKVIRTYMEAYDRVVQIPTVNDQYLCEGCGGWHLTSRPPKPRVCRAGLGNEKTDKRREQRKRKRARDRLEAKQAERDAIDEANTAPRPQEFLTRAQLHERWGWTDKVLSDQHHTPPETSAINECPTRSVQRD